MYQHLSSSGLQSKVNFLAQEKVSNGHEGYEEVGRGLMVGWKEKRDADLRKALRPVSMHSFMV